MHLSNGIAEFDDTCHHKLPCDFDVVASEDELEDLVHALYESGQGGDHSIIRTNEFFRHSSDIPPASTQDLASTQDFSTLS